MIRECISEKATSPKCHKSRPDWIEYKSLNVMLDIHMQDYIREKLSVSMTIWLSHDGPPECWLHLTQPNRPVHSLQAALAIATTTAITTATTTVPASAFTTFDSIIHNPFVLLVPANFLVRNSFLPLAAAVQRLQAASAFKLPTGIVLLCKGRTQLCGYWDLLGKFL